MWTKWFQLFALCSGTFRADSRLAPSQWETLQSNVVSHWLGTNLESPPDSGPCFCFFLPEETVFFPKYWLKCKWIPNSTEKFIRTWNVQQVLCQSFLEISCNKAASTYCKNSSWGSRGSWLPLALYKHRHQDEKQLYRSQWPVANCC